MLVKGLILSGEIWDEPVRGGTFPAHLLGLSGIEQLRMFLEGKAAPPPVSHLTGTYPTEVGVGSATFVMPITGWLQISPGLMTAGGVAILADSPLAWAIQSALPPTTGYATTELSINMVRRVPDEGRLVARGHLVHLGRRLGLSEVFVTDDAGRLIAHGTSRCVIFPPAADVPAPAPEVADVREQDDGWIAPFMRPVCGAVLDQEIFATRTGLELMRGLVSGELPLPPAACLLGARPIEAGEGTCTFSMPATGWVTSPTGLVLGGVTACLADFALGAAMHTTVAPGTAVAPTDLRVQFIRPVPGDGRQVTARATVVHRGRGLASARAEVTNSEAKLLALANASALVLPGRRADLSDAPPLG
jgi:uncharacterized protein (TIGR00369 family)